MELTQYQEVKAIIKSVVLSSAKRITIDQLERDYEEFEGKYIPYKLLGFTDLESLLLNMSDSIRMHGCGPMAVLESVPNEKTVHLYDFISEQKNTNNNKKIMPNHGNNRELNAQSIAENSNDDIGSTNDENSAILLENGITKVKFRKNMVQVAENIRNFPFHCLKEGVIKSINLSYIGGVFDFYFQLNERLDELNTLMTSLQNCYSRLSSSELYLPIDFIKQEQVCCVLHEYIWYRGIINSSMDGLIKIFLVDFGDTITTNIENVKYLLSYYADTPIQACPGALSHIKCEEESKHLKTSFQMLTRSGLYAKIITIVDNRAHMILCTKTDNVKIQINDRLISIGLAAYDHNWLKDFGLLS